MNRLQLFFTVAILCLPGTSCIRKIPNQDEIIKVTDDQKCGCANPKNTRFKAFESLQKSQRIPGYFWYQDGKECASSCNRPHLLFFTGHGVFCCRSFLENGFYNPQVVEMIRENFVLTSLYVDDRKVQLKPEEWIINHVEDDTLKTLGGVNSQFQIDRFQTNAQPYFVILDDQENVLATMNYESDPEKYLRFLRKGLNGYQTR